jgi:hypothetical protein
MTVMKPDESQPHGYRLVDVPTLTDAEQETLRMLAAQHEGDKAAVLFKVLKVVQA